MKVCIYTLSMEEDADILDVLTKNIIKGLTKLGIKCTRGNKSEECDISIALGFGRSLNKNARGIEVMYSSANLQNERIAKYVLEGVASAAGLMNRGIKETGMPWDIMVICGYITNYSDRQKLRQYTTKNKIVWGIVEGLKRYLLFWTTANDKILKCYKV